MILANRIDHLHVLLVVVLKRILGKSFFRNGPIEDVLDLLAAL